MWTLLKAVFPLAARNELATYDLGLGTIQRPTNTPQLYEAQYQAQLFAGDNQPLAYLELKSIGLPGDRTKALSADLCQLISTELAIAPDRIYIEFHDAPRNMWGWNGSTFER